ALALDAGRGQVFLGGTFTAVDGSARDRAAKVDADDGILVAGWIPGYHGADTVIAMAFDAVADDLYVGGVLKMTVGAGGHHRAIGRLAGDTGARDTGWSARVHPMGGAQVWAIAVDATHVYFGGQFRRVLTSTRNNIARVAKSNGALDNGWNPNAGGPVRALAQDGTGLLVGGEFSQIGGGAKLRLARLDATGAADAAFSADADRVVRTIVPAGTDAVIGGAFRFLGGDAEEGIARIAAATGARDAGFDGTAGGPGKVNAFAFDASGGVIAGGEFDFVEQAGDATVYSRANMLRLNPDFSLDTGWAADVSGDVQGLTISGTVLFIGGSFVQVTNPAGGAATARMRLASYNISGATPTLLAWAPAADGEVRELLADADGIYASGLFSTLAGAARAFVGRLDPVTGAAHTWAPNPDGPVHAIHPLGPEVYLGGDFSTAGGATRANLALVDDTAGTDTGVLSADSDNVIRAFAFDGSLLYLGGDFSMVQGVAHIGAARLDTGTSTVDADWDPTIPGSVHSLALDGVNGWIYFGGSFATAGGVAHPNLARASTADAEGGVDPAWRPGSNGPVVQIAGLATSDVLVGGDFSSVTNLPRGGLARIGPDGSDLTAIAIDSIVPSPSVAGQTWTVSFTVSNTSGGGTPTGSVTVTTDFAEACGPVVLDGAGQGSCQITSTGAGDRIVSASYTADDPALMDSDTTAAHTVNQAATTLSLSGDPTIIVEGDTVTFTWSVTVVAPGAGVPTGTVTVSEIGGLMCSASVAAGTCDIAIAPAGNYDFNGSYSGDADFLGDDDGPVQVDVQSGGPLTTDISVRHQIVASGILSDGSGDLVDYELEVTNNGPSADGAVDVDMLMPPEFNDIAWTCAGSGGGTCSAPSGSGDIAISASLPVGGSILIELAVRIVDPNDNGVETTASADPTTATELDPSDNSATTFYRSCSTSEIVGDRPLPEHVCGFRDGFEDRD
ncbi:MAG TPA: Ig-like domain repeat protein, partial [Xanthomonadaceae bacterium]|nr:Ig-like domain repeat protein [Xanthomonadaceae bacterium]